MARSVQPGGPRFSPKNLASTSASADLGELGRLEVEGPERDPALRAHLHVAEEQHVDEHARASAR